MGNGRLSLTGGVFWGIITFFYNGIRAFSKDFWKDLI